MPIDMFCKLKYCKECFVDIQHSIKENKAIIIKNETFHFRKSFKAVIIL